MPKGMTERTQRATGSLYSLYSCTYVYSDTLDTVRQQKPFYDFPEEKKHVKLIQKGKGWG